VVARAKNRIAGAAAHSRRPHFRATRHSACVDHLLHRLPTTGGSQETPLLFPHVLNTHTYRTTGLFLWDHPKDPLEYHNQQFEDFYNGWEREAYKNTWADVARSPLKKTRSRRQHLLLVGRGASPTGIAFRFSSIAKCAYRF